MAKGKLRRKMVSQKAQAKANRMTNPGRKSRYGQKHEYLHKHGGWGWEYATPKPWK
jgi:hypothetical protein